MPQHTPSERAKKRLTLMPKFNLAGRIKQLTGKSLGEILASMRQQYQMLSPIVPKLRQALKSTVASRKVIRRLTGRTRRSP